MDRWHRKFLVLQIIILLFIFIVRILFPEELRLLLIGIIFFILFEFGVLERQRQENPKAVMYEKSCLFTFSDLLSAGLFIYEFIQLSRGYLFNHYYLINPFLLIYIAIRKFYIMKNYSYEK
ncbi:Uncharacterised protein [Chryseobacterium nakagawai]|uniref:Uncharacterized protein n=1 Tax=Chryseobacterium nakagawai TaxID=1241982 RepID=A0AAD1DTK1_CHRNA|nr:hypothetical protein EG343_21815 [Chryseobacterium nakagawai]VEH19682.1 Uncharacterised protein [Chryseobacterium nakagawai]